MIFRLFKFNLICVCVCVCVCVCEQFWKCYQLNILKKIKKNYKKKLMKDIKIFLKKKKKKKQQYGCECYKTLSEDEKNKLVVYRKNIIEWEIFRKFCYFIRESIRSFFLSHLCLKSSPSTSKNMWENIKNVWFLDFTSSILKMYFLMEQFFKKYFWNLFFEGAFLREKFYCFKLIIC